MADVARKTRIVLQHELVNLLPIADLELGREFLQQIKIHYSNNVDLEMTQDWLYNVAISKAHAKEKCQWLKIWNGNKNMKEENHFPIGPFKGNDAFDPWRNK
jgi:hypothetical protein